MPDRDVKTIRDLIWYQYAKIIVRRALGAADSDIYDFRFTIAILRLPRPSTSQ